MRGHTERGVAVVGLRIITGTTGLAQEVVARILGEVGLSLADLGDDRRRVPWDVLTGVVERCGQAMGEEAFVASGLAAVQTIPEMVPLARRFVEPFSMMRFVCEVLDAAAYPMVTFKVDLLGPLRFQVRYTLDADHVPSPLFWRYCAANLAGMPAYYGSPPAQFTVTQTGRSGEVILEWPPHARPSPGDRSPNLDTALKLVAALGVDIVRLFSEGFDARIHADRAAHLGAMVQHLVAELTEPAFVVDRAGKAYPANARARAALREEGATLEAEVVGHHDDGRYATLSLLDEQRLVVRRAEAPSKRGLREADREARALRRVLGLLPLPLVVVDASGAVVCASLGAERVLAARDDLTMRTGTLTSTWPPDNEAITAAITATTHASGRSETGGPRIVELSRSVEQPLGLIFLPLAARDADASDGDDARVLVVLHDPSTRVRLNPSLIAKLHGLTATEAATAAALAEGMSLAEIADARGSSEQTVRTHLKRVLANTGTHRQADLVRVLLSGAAMQLASLE